MDIVEFNKAIRVYYVKKRKVFVLKLLIPPLHKINSYDDWKINRWNKLFLNKLMVISS